MGGVLIFGLLCILGFAQSGTDFESELAYAGDIRQGQRIVGGWEAEDGQFPHTVSLRMVGPTGGVGACTGSLLTDQWTLTAGHCVARRFTIIVYVGQTNITQPGYMFEASVFFPHPLYDQEITYVQTDDIGLLQLNKPVPFGANIQPIRIQSSRRRNVEYGDVQLTISGYGRTDDWWLGGIIPDIMYWVYQRGITQVECRTWYPYSQVIDVQTMCSVFYNESSQNPCTGDSGGALTMVDVDGKITQVGIMSFGAARGCNSPNAQGYVRPEYYHDWIEMVTGISFDWDPQDLEPRKDINDETPIFVN